MNNSKNEFKKSFDTRSSNLYNRIIQSQFLLITSERIKGCSEAEIAKIEQTYKLLCIFILIKG